ncbi:MAG: hypothetical protein CMJ59_01120 [Planctomycetaceae bacterium]|nr:hypothetical protein [Planctomycetaceae bacterium]
MPKITTPWFHHRSMNDYQKANPKPGNQNPKAMKTRPATSLGGRHSRFVFRPGGALPIIRKTEGTGQRETPVHRWFRSAAD